MDLDGKTEALAQRSHAGHPVVIAPAVIGGGNFASEACEEEWNLAVAATEIDHRPGPEGALEFGEMPAQEWRDVIDRSHAVIGVPSQFQRQRLFLGLH